MVSPELHIGRLAVEDVAESGVARIGRTGKHSVAAAYLTGEQHAVAVVGEEGIFHLVEGFKILRPRQADGGAVVAVAPAHPVFAVQKGHTRVVAIDPFGHFRVGPGEAEHFRLDVPVDAVLGKACVEGHPAVGVVTAENAGESILERNHGTVEDAVGVWQQVPGNHRILGIAPEGSGASGRPVFPGDVGEGWTAENLIFSHIHLFPGRSLFDVLESLIDDCVDMVIGKGIHDLLAVSPALHELRVLKNAELVRNR